ncbi:MAG: glycosyltransferase family 4 protein [Thermoplasmata archaeon]|nr:glycosyltransferase family 4 protein [Thermoplasmata archaeon]
MRVCFLAPELLPNQGGVGTYSVELLREMAGRVDLTVLTPLRTRGTDVYDRHRLEEYFGHRITVLPISEAKDTFRYNFDFQRAVRRTVPALIREGKFDLIHSQHAHMPDLLLGHSSKFPPTVRTIHTTIDGQRHGIKIARHLQGGLEPSERYQLWLAPALQTAEWMVLNRVGDSYIAVSGWMGQELIRRGFAPERVHVIHCGGDPSRFGPDRGNASLLRSRPDRRVVLFPGRPTIVKGAAVLAQALPRILEQFPSAEFVFTGGGAEDFLQLVPLSETLRSHIRFLGYIPFDDLPRIYASADLVIAPTYYENFPIRILEALASGVAVVASSVGGIPEAVRPGSTGTLVPAGDPVRLADAIVELLRDDALRARMGQQGRRLIEEKFSWSRAADDTLELYRKIAG